ncbi:hypothetical protein PAXRUDRAFT_138819, partial [Paxillus rubicundulus Ve08.2h10]
SVLAHAKNANLSSAMVTRSNIPTPYPEVVKKIMQQHTLHEVGIALNTSHCCGIIVGMLCHMVPEVLTTQLKDGSTFKYSDTWVQTFLYDNLSYTMHKGTCAAQKLPQNLDEVCQDQFL